ncbi:hypothetical protein H4219_005400 [Mycoemilia scoparia]|uniref:SH3 domain-containing protein n=1 Tax=Mycoemilia scoparia TaxID=417184 RepID=A0A9W7ZTV2_9FUNG|nr:hypothetical protein H4219_005400 [Mycoemilia scoparia]
MATTSGTANNDYLYAEALYTFSGECSQDLPFRKGDIIEILDCADSKWWRGRIVNSSKDGLFPACLVKLCQEYGIPNPSKSTADRIARLRNVLTPGYSGPSNNGSKCSMSAESEDNETKDLDIESLLLNMANNEIEYHKQQQDQHKPKPSAKIRFLYEDHSIDKQEAPPTPKSGNNSLNNKPNRNTSTNSNSSIGNISLNSKGSTLTSINSLKSGSMLIGPRAMPKSKPNKEPSVSNIEFKNYSRSNPRMPDSPHSSPDSTLNSKYSIGSSNYGSINNESVVDDRRNFGGSFTASGQKINVTSMVYSDNSHNNQSRETMKSEAHDAEYLFEDGDVNEGFDSGSVTRKYHHQKQHEQYQYNNAEDHLPVNSPTFESVDQVHSPVISESPSSPVSSVLELSVSSSYGLANSDVEHDHQEYGSTSLVGGGRDSNEGLQKSSVTHYTKDAGLDIGKLSSTPSSETNIPRVPSKRSEIQYASKESINDLNRSSPEFNFSGDFEKSTELTGSKSQVNLSTIFNKSNSTINSNSGETEELHSTIGSLPNINQMNYPHTRRFTAQGPEHNRYQPPPQPPMHYQQHQSPYRQYPQRHQRQPSYEQPPPPHSASAPDHGGYNNNGYPENPNQAYSNSYQPSVTAPSPAPQGPSPYHHPHHPSPNINGNNQLKRPPSQVMRPMSAVSRCPSSSSYSGSTIGHFRNMANMTPFPSNIGSAPTPAMSSSTSNHSQMTYSQPAAPTQQFVQDLDLSQTAPPPSKITMPNYIKLAKQVVRPNAKVSSQQPNTAVNWEKVDRHVELMKNISSRVNPEGLALRHVARPFQTEIDKVRAVFMWVAQNIVFDMSLAMDDNEYFEQEEPAEVLRRRLSRGPGFANLTNTMLSTLGIESSIVRGYLRQPNDRYQGPVLPIANHTWNIVCIDGESRIIDTACASAGHPLNSSGILDPWFFLTSPKEIIYTHYPLLPQNQFLDPIISLPVFWLLPYVRPTYFMNKVKLLNLDFPLINLTDDEVKPLMISLSSEQLAVHAEIEFLDQNNKTTSKQPLLAQCMNYEGKRMAKIIVTAKATNAHGLLKIYTGVRVPLRHDFDPDQKSRNKVGGFMQSGIKGLIDNRRIANIEKLRGKGVDSEGNMEGAPNSETYPLSCVINIRHFGRANGKLCTLINTYIPDEFYIRKPHEKEFHLGDLVDFNITSVDKKKLYKMKLRGPNGHSVKFVYEPGTQTYVLRHTFKERGPWIVLYDTDSDRWLPIAVYKCI